MTATKAQAFIAGRCEAKKCVVPMVNGEYGFSVVCGHNVVVLLVRYVNYPQSCTQSCHYQSDCPGGVCKTSGSTPKYYCTSFSWSHNCSTPISGVNCRYITESDSDFARCKAACTSLKGASANNISNSGYCDWGVQNGTCSY